MNDQAIEIAQACGSWFFSCSSSRARRTMSMYAEIGFSDSTWITQPGASAWVSLAGSEKKIPDAYSQVRVTNGSSWLTSEMNVPIRAKTRVTPTLNIVCRSN